MRIFNNQAYLTAGHFNTKTNAQEVAKKIRKLGNCARVTKEVPASPRKPYYIVWWKVGKKPRSKGRRNNRGRDYNKRNSKHPSRNQT